MPFVLNKAVAHKRSFFTHTGIGKVRPKVEITVDDVERLVGEGYSRKELAKYFKVSYGYLNRRINEAESLRQAEQRGKEINVRSTRKI